MSRPSPTPQTSLQSLFRDTVAAYPDAIALHVAGRDYSYAELDALGRSWADSIVAALGRPAARVAILARRNLVAYAGVIAALYAGATFVPLNPRFPPLRTRRMLQAADVDAIVVDNDALGMLAALGDDTMPAVVLAPECESPPQGVLGRDDVSRSRASATLPPAADIAYLLFTSGTTGDPKGIGVTQRNVVAFLDVVRDRWDFGTEQRFSQTFDQTFDLSVFDLFVAWSHAGAVYVLRDIDLVAPDAFVRGHELDVWFSVPSIPALMRRKNLLRADLMPSLRWSFFCGEALTASIATAWARAAPASIVENLYGPTEVTIACCAYRWSAQTSPAACEGDIVPIGRPFAGLEAVVVDPMQFPVAAGDSGELCLAGPQVVPGYWRDAARTAESFVELPGHGTRTFYRTGDVVRLGSDGELRFLGRLDDQVQVAGHRVEIREVEAALRTLPGVADVVVVGWPRQDGLVQALTAFVTGENLDGEQLRHDAALRLPPYMTPRRIVPVPAFPLNANGKTDRNALLRQLETEGA